MHSLESTKLLLAVNPENSTSSCANFIKNNLFRIFSNQNDWTFSINCKVNNCPKYTLGIFCLEGEEFGIYIDPKNHFLLNCKDQNQKSVYLVADFNGFEMIKNDYNNITLSYNYESNCYNLHLNSELIFNKMLIKRYQIDISKIKLMSICRSFLKEDQHNNSDNLQIKSMFFAEKIFSPTHLEKIADSKNDAFYIDKYGRSCLKAEYSENMLAYYDFNNTLYGKIWDCTGNNNFLFTSLDIKNRQNNSVL